MAKYGSYVPGSPDPILEARRRGNTGFRDNSIANAAMEMNRDRNAAYHDAGGVGPRPGDISLNTVAPRVAKIEAAKVPEPSFAPEQRPTSAAQSEPWSAISRAAAPPTKDLPEFPRYGGAYEGPTEWGSDYSLAQVAHDEAARAGISDRYIAGVERANAEDAARGNPFEDQINARKRTLAYESLMPAYGGMDASGRPTPYEPSLKLNGVEQRQDHAPSWPLRGDVAGIERANAMMKPKDRLETDQAFAREDAVRKLRELQAKIEQDVATNKKSREQGDQFLKAALLDAATKGALAEGDFKALASFMFPNPESVMAQEARTTQGRQ